MLLTVFKDFGFVWHLVQFGSELTIFTGCPQALADPTGLRPDRHGAGFVRVEFSGFSAQACANFHRGARGPVTYSNHDFMMKFRKSGILEKLQIRFSPGPGQ